MSDPNRRKVAPITEIPDGVPVLRPYLYLVEIPYDYRDLRMMFTSVELQIFTVNEIMAVVNGKTSISEIRMNYMPKSQ